MGLVTRGWLILTLCLGFAYSQTPITPGVTEIDLIFPRNESYSPSPVTPIVFTIQNPSLLSSLNPEISYYIEQQNVNTNESVSTSGSIQLSKINYTTSDPYFLYWSTGHLDIEGTFVFAWELQMNNCSYSPQSDALTFGYFGSRRHELYFSTKNGTSSPDFVAATEDDTCDQSQAQAVQVPDLLEVPATRTWGAPSCAATVGPSPAPNPCKVKIDSTAAASISAALASSACANPIRTGLSCPTPSSESAASAAQSPVVGHWILAIGMLLAYSLAS
ncbi:hypothetical protein IFM58399_03992 [Aspergillus lentulus]|uniref:DUF7136 domain-containing protein n=1 Tax=Aspergillus lentulus TaxID=293939 RepID=A0ABQ1AED1_ASPLE|nr:uncharacterized protein IFM58399_03992 [Aspergillus lentulus]GFF34785.1 hypothetical protein IFM58399_03992 [Aspergillus lentulus]GFF80124.1 hypothetical protein IFM60648_05652 [Aspergillus lentulus]GFF90769.1 hypothetical protein IFM47457_08608 [Aspergillus lentulus]GFG14009.1 hypothetical protein IFM61392_08227 [Aspergillus lentulus]